METPSPTDQGPISGNAPLYHQPEPLNPEQHGKLGLKTPSKPYAFAKDQHFLPLLGPEFPAAGCSYPIIFAGEEFMPLAVMGLSPGENLFFTGDELRPDVYLPAYMRRYPFTTALDAAADRMIICIDRGSDVIGENPDAAFFENGELTDYTKGCIKFCEDFEADRNRTMQFVEKLKALDLFEHREATFNPPPQPDGTVNPSQTVAGFNAISETKFAALNGATLAELRDLGYLQAIYAHLSSMMHWDRLIAMALQRRAEEQQAADDAAAKDAASSKKAGKKPN